MATNYAVPTGEFIAEWLEENEMRPAELARRAGVSRKHISELIHGKATLSFDVAESLEIVTRVPARIWMNYESQYRADVARLQRDEAIGARFGDIGKFPLDYLRRIGAVTADWDDRGGVGRQVLSFFGVSDIDTLLAQPQRVLASFRQSAAYEVDSFSVATWIQAGCHEAKSRNLPKYDPDALRAMLPELRALTVKSVDVFSREMVELPAKAGVVVVLDAGPMGTRCSGVTHWVQKRPVVQLTDRGKKNDALWFTYFHELGHVLLHPQNETFIESGASPGTVNAREDEADRFARDLLIPPADWEHRPRGKNLAAVERYARQLGIHPGVVIGRLHRETGDYKWGHGLKQTLHIVDD
ncbi:putative Xre family DNA-binding protein [Gordonia namibiensis NBRC 108229]|uniref:Putative Xre family DNA-binding protein n=1 Tax=Gordonia namibiensis NBRC 108229 TaxID=1208314 RepID=K6XNL2_9ACTN|nr:ImmA/IrrE family metallo-endopeptidase [Gordonia namibiensis]GAC00405.1 putative Xre family DNA-binding protein [Gordonia namibiensis NBRC 108229]